MTVFLCTIICMRTVSEYGLGSNCGRAMLFLNVQRVLSPSLWSVQMLSIRGTVKLCKVVKEKALCYWLLSLQLLSPHRGGGPGHLALLQRPARSTKSEKCGNVRGLDSDRAAVASFACFRRWTYGVEAGRGVAAHSDMIVSSYSTSEINYEFTRIARPEVRSGFPGLSGSLAFGMLVAEMSMLQVLHCRRSSFIAPKCHATSPKECVSWEWEGCICVLGVLRYWASNITKWMGSKEIRLINSEFFHTFKQYFCIKLHTCI